MANRGRDAPSDSPAGGSPRILLAEDGPAFRKALIRMLESAGYEVEAFADGTSAMARLLETGLPRFDVVLADVRMPGMDGLELIAALRTAIADPPACLFMSGDLVALPPPADPDEPEPEILVKPFGADELLSAVGRTLS